MKELALAVLVVSIVAIIWYFSNGGRGWALPVAFAVLAACSMCELAMKNKTMGGVDDAKQTQCIQDNDCNNWQYDDLTRDACNAACVEQAST
jgi:hypothetical protein